MFRKSISPVHIILEIIEEEVRYGYKINEMPAMRSNNAI